MNDDKLREVVLQGLDFLRIANIGVRAAQEESRRLGVPNVYSIDGQIYYELPNGELSLTDPYVEPVKPLPVSPDAPASSPASPAATSPFG